MQAHNCVIGVTPMIEFASSKNSSEAFVYMLERQTISCANSLIIIELCYDIKPVRKEEGKSYWKNSFMRWRCYQGKIMLTTSKNFSVLYVLRKHPQRIIIQWHHLRCYFWLIDHPILGQVATPRSFQLESILECPALDVRQLVRNKRRKEYDSHITSQWKKNGPFNISVLVLTRNLQIIRVPRTL